MQYTALQVRWFDYHLRGVNNGIMQEPPVRIFVMGINKMRDENEWPIARAVKTRYYLTSARSGSARAGPPAEAKCLPRPAIIPVLPLARRFRDAPRRVVCVGRALSGAPPRDELRNASAPTSGISRRGQQR